MESNLEAVSNQDMLSFEAFRKTVLEDYRTALASREVSLLGRREVLTGKAKFGIFGDGKEIAQVALAKFFQKGDFRSGYYRDQTLMFALGTSNVVDYFAQLYADVENDPYSGGRNMNSHFSTPFVNEKGDHENPIWVTKCLENEFLTGKTIPFVLPVNLEKGEYKIQFGVHSKYSSVLLNSPYYQGKVK